MYMTIVVIILCISGLVLITSMSEIDAHLISFSVSSESVMMWSIFV